MRFALLVLVGLAGIVPAGAQTAPGGAGTPWAPWVGCWTVSMANESTDVARPRAAAAGRGAAARPRVCVEARGPAATLTTSGEGVEPMTQRIVADGTPSPFSDGVCTGTQQVTGSADGHRLYSTANLTCQDGTTRSVSGLSLLGADGTWVEAQSMDIGGRASVRVRRFVRSDDGRPGPAARRLTIDDVKEASARVAAPALEAALVETKSTFALNAARLLDLDEARVPHRVIDVMVALTYPQAFVVRPAGRADRLTPFPFDLDATDATYAWGLPTFGGVGGYFDSAYFLSPFGYSYLSSYPLVFGAVGGSSDGGGTREGNRPRNDQPGRVVDGKGYTRLSSRSDESGSGQGARGAGGNTVTSQGFSRGGDQGSSSSGGGGTSGGSTSGGSSGADGSSGRTAVPR